MWIRKTIRGLLGTGGIHTSKNRWEQEWTLANRSRSLYDISSREQSWPLSNLITLAGAFFVCRSACLSDSLFSRTIRTNVPGSVLIREEMALVIMSTLVNREDNEQYYFYALFCTGALQNFQFPLNKKWLCTLMSKPLTCPGQKRVIGASRRSGIGMKLLP